ncbi:E3 SUMO-protein ligase ZBED1 isoform X2 [Neocloeon triangulifer]|uniref:E3 SUMO-protein ligase ZBED1 isoform X2 n=1 Tax=Neocloeon triangulifer TaxID=2078957 RepID=UPI00286F39D3|nr:E3 SUMO-protein ligase ZBED1 isoform X2 [Neocloeon triangulifer]
MDLATLTNSTRNFLIVTMKCLDKFDALTSVTLGAIHTENRGTAENIKEIVTGCFQANNISESQIVAITTDGGSNLIKAADLMDKDHIPCFCHVCDNIVSSAYSQCRVLNVLVDDVKGVVTYFKRSSLAMNILRKKQREATGKSLELIQAVKTRWNSTYACIKRFSQLYPYVSSALKDPQIKKVKRDGSTEAPKITDDTVEILKQCLPLLQPFDVITRKLSSSEKVTSSTALFSVEYLETTLKNSNPTNSVAKELKERLIEQMQQRFEAVKNNQVLQAASFIDSRFRNLLSEKAKESTRSYLLRQMKEISLPEEADEENHTTAERDEVDDFFDIGEDQEASVQINVSPELELEKYECENATKWDFNDDPLKFWIKNRALYPRLARVSLGLLTVPGSAVDSERGVSQLNLVARKHRSKLSSLNINRLVCLRSLPICFWERLLNLRGHD